MEISAVLACHDEEPFILPWLERNASYASEILIAVHAPTDATAALIAQFEAQSPVPIRCEWFPAQTVARFGYSVMKNEMIARAAGDWITSIDADEEIGLTPEGLRRAIDEAEAAGLPAVSLRWAEHPDPGRIGEGRTMARRDALRREHRSSDPPLRKCKIFRNRDSCWWRGLVHERVVRRGRDALESCHHADAALHHFSYLRRAEPEWKGPLYAALICRIRDCPHLRPGTHRSWYGGHYERDEAGIRAEAARFEARRLEWFPERPRGAR